MTATLETNVNPRSGPLDRAEGAGGGLEALAVRYIGDMLHRAILSAGAPLKVSEAARACNRPDVDLRLARVVLASSLDRFASADRKWTVLSRGADATRPVERTIEDTLESFGMPLPAAVIAGELSIVYDRPVDAMLTVASRLISDSERFARIGDLGYARRCWLLDVQADDPEDVLFDNFLTEDDIAPYESNSSLIASADPACIAAYLDAADKPVPSKVLQFLAWRSGPARFVPAELLRGLSDTGAVCLSGREWIGPKLVASLAGLFATIAERPVADDAEARTAEAAQPLTINDEEREQLVDFVMRTEATSHVSRMLEDIFEVSPGEPTFEADRQSVLDCLRSDPRVVWIGGDRFLPVGAIPDYVFTVPDNLAYVEGQYFDQEGNEIDILLEDDGLTGGLKGEVMSPLAQDIGDEEDFTLPEGDAPVTVRCVLRFHHKEIGTFPLCQLPPGYFPSEAPIVQVEVALPNGHTAQAWVNHENRLLYGLLEWYDTVPIDSGAVFYVERKAPDRYVLTFGEETEPAMFVSRNRLNDLLDLRRKADEEEMSTFDVLREIMEHYRKGIEFITVLTELCMVRRTRRRNVASLLSGYHCFFQRNKAWVFDLRKLSQGFDRSKRKYLVHR
ncbi:MAG: hypothetical protein FJX72_07145 [Armatimonadetes bacterium]|nr:hypothetical protein [Armatimonadota bacterium]